MTKIQIKILSFFLGIPITLGVNFVLNYILIVDTKYCFEYRFPKLSWLLDIFFDGHHYDPNGLYFILIVTLGCFISYKLLCFIFKPVDD